MISVFDRLRREMPDAGLVLQVHDELVVAVREGMAEEAATLVKSAMESAVELAVPLKAGTGTGRDWLEAGH
jgi:DNA polymerase-1